MPQLATPAARDARPRVWAALATLEERRSRPDTWPHVVLTSACTCQSRPCLRPSTPRSNHHFGAIIFAALVAGRLLAEVPVPGAKNAEAAEAAEAGRPGTLARPESMWSILGRYVVADSQ